MIPVALFASTGPLLFGQAPAVASTSQAVNVITLDQAIALAERNDPAYATSVADRGSAQLDRSISRSALLPSASYLNQYLYTQPNGLLNQAGQGVAAQPAPRFIANNAIREYASQALITETVSAAGFADFKRAGALARKAGADLEIARRDLVVRVVSGYFGLLAADARLRAAQAGADEATAFRVLTGKLEAGREVAHADVVKADLVLQQRQRESSDAALAAEKARLDLGALLFPDPRTNYQVAAQEPSALAAEPEIEAAAARQNPDLKSALEAAKAAEADVEAARAGYFPTLSLNYTYGIDAPQFAVNGPDHVRNLGYSALVSLEIPVWDWLATHDRVKQSELRRKAA
ncbi:MAG TPA: TolC family protein, partial [Acidobacteriaceae bacterium]|nr:TolC family protein [Acidobacteriaceae bacterium]